MGKKAVSEFVHVNLKISVNNLDNDLASIARLMRDGDYVDDKKIIKLKGKDLVMYLLAARVKELNSEVEVKKEVTEPSLIQNNHDKMKAFGVKISN